MSYPRRAENDQIVDAYQRTGSIWKAALELGLAGQSVWERLRALGFKLAGAAWTDEEVAEVRTLAGTMTIGAIANRLGRPYAGVACKMSELHIAAGHPRVRKVPRGAGLNKATMKKLMRAAELDPRPVTKFCRANKLTVDTFVLAAQKYEPARWLVYAAARSPFTSRACDYCEAVFVPTNTRQKTCSRKCQRDHRVDRLYFGGKRRTTIGLAECICQLCGKHTPKGLSSHHVLGKENDPDNEYLVALCMGCHQVVGILGRADYVTTEKGWENLISLVAMRRLAEMKGDKAGVHVAVDLEWLTRAEVIEAFE